MKRKNEIKKSNKTKKAFIVSLASMLICGLLLIGSTYAWFTDSAVSGRNKIESGNLDIELHRLSSSGQKEIITDATHLFDVESWEPGVVAYETFEVDNIGSLALKYHFAMNLGASNTITDNGKSLKDILKVNIIDGEFTGSREDVYALEYPYSLSNFERENTLQTSGSSDKFTVFIYWLPTENDDDYNLNNGRTTSDGEPLFVELGVNLTATQSSYESDSFGKDYDATYHEATDLNGLIAAVSAAQDGDGVKLTQDIEMPYGLFQFNPGTMIIDLNGHTLKSTVRTTSKIDEGNHFILKNGKLELHSSSIANATLSVSKNASLTLQNVEFTTADSGGITTEGTNAQVNIIDSTIRTLGLTVSTNARTSDFYNPIFNIKNSNLSSMENGAGTPILVNIPCKMNIDGSTLTGYRHGLVVRGGTVTVKNSTITNTISEAIIAEYAPSNYGDKDWGSGNMLPVATLVIGNKGSAYQYPSDVSLMNTKLISNLPTGTTLSDVYIYGNTTEGNGATFAYDETSEVGSVEQGNEFATVIVPERS